MDQIWPITTAVMWANGMTLLFGYGLWRLKQNEDFNIHTALCLFVPMALFGGGLLVYG